MGDHNSNKYAYKDKYNLTHHGPVFTKIKPRIAACKDIVYASY